MQLPSGREHRRDRESAWARAVQALNVRPRRATARSSRRRRVGAGEGDLVLVALGSAVRELDGLSGVAADAAIVAIVDS
jgi:microcompartment protein CcmK/EutM